MKDEMIKLMTTLIEEHGNLLQENSRYWEDIKYLQTTIDMIFDALVKSTTRGYEGKPSFYASDDLVKVLEYRHPAEYQSMVRSAEEKLVKTEAIKREKAQQDELGDVDVS